MPWAGPHRALRHARGLRRRSRRTRRRCSSSTRAARPSCCSRSCGAINEDSLPIALHHGSLDVGQRRRSRRRWRTNSLRAVVATSTLDLGIDWGDVDLVIHVGAPKGASRLAQRIGRANHRMDEPSKAILVPANRFEVLECRAALDANYLGAQDTPPLRRRRARRAGAARARHGLRRAVRRRSSSTTRSLRAAPYRELDRETFDRVVDFVATGGYALRTYERYATHPPDQGRPLARRQSARRPAIPAERRHHRRGADAERALRRAQRQGHGRRAAGRCSARSRNISSRQLTPGDTFLFAGQVLRFEGIRENECFVSNAAGDGRRRSRPMPAASSRSRPISPSQVRAHAGRPGALEARCPSRSRDWLRLQQREVGAAAAATSCWSRPFRAATATTWSPIRSRAGWRTRRSACC